MRKLLNGAVLAALIGGSAGSAFGQQAVTAEQVAGVWKFHSGVSHDETTNTDKALPITAGYLSFVQIGKNARVVVITALGDRKPAGSTPTDAEIAQLYKSFGAYSGLIEFGTTASSDGTPIVNNVDLALNPAMPGKLSRVYRVSGSTLTVTLKASDGHIETSIWDKVQ